MRERFRQFAGAALLIASVATFASDEGRFTDRQATLSSKAFLDAHPDMKFRNEGLIAYEEGRFDEARDSFLKAARFADKPSQAMLAEMAWKGIGQPADRVLGYVWADLSAERGYRLFIVLRETYWGHLAPEDRTRAIEIGQPVMDEFGDAVARTRLTKHLRKARWTMIGGRPRKNVTVIVPGPSGMPIRIRGHHFYANEFWEPELYHKWVDQLWNDAPTGTVEIGPLEKWDGDE